MKVMIDQGHSGHTNQSPIDPNYYESVTVWQLGLYLQAELQKRGVQADLTRSSLDEELDLVERGKKSKGYDLFISLHTNSTGDNKPSDSADFPVCYTQISGATDTLADMFLDKLAKMFDSKGYPYKEAKKNDQGTDWYGVLRGAAEVGTPGIIVEHGFHTNRYNLMYLESDAFLRNLAKADAEVIQKWWASKTSVVSPNATSLYGVVTGVPAGDDGLNVRIGPGSNFDNLAAWPKLGNGNRVDIFGRDNDQKWLYVRIAGEHYGWVRSTYILLS